MREREVIAGDLLEEFREEILPARGQMRAHWWYLRQVVSFAWCRDTRFAVRVCAMWFTIFCGAAAFALTRETFAAAYAVGVFLSAVPLSAFYIARKTDWFGLAFASSFVLQLALLSVCALTVTPPGSFWLPIEVGTTLAFLSAIAGKCSLPVFEVSLEDALRAARQQTLPPSSC